MSDKRYGLKLKGANGESATAHTVPPLPGFYFIDKPTPVGGDGELPLDVARAALKDPVDEDGKRTADGYYGLGDVLELVTIKSGEVEDAKDLPEEMLVARRAARWARENGDNQLLRIVLCGLDGEHDMPSSWRCIPWRGHGGYGLQAHGRGRENRERERLWLSPHCIRADAPQQLQLVGGTP